MKRTDTIIHVELTEPLSGIKNFYFGSISAIFDTLAHETIHVKVKTLYKFGIKPLKPYKNKYCTIHKSVVQRKEGGRTPPIIILRVI